MAVDKLVDSTQLDSDLTSVANAIRTKSGGSSQLAFPSGFVSAIGDIPSGGGGVSANDWFTGGVPDTAIIDDVIPRGNYAFACAPFRVIRWNISQATASVISAQYCFGMTEAEIIVIPYQGRITGYYFFRDSKKLQTLDVGTSTFHNTICNGCSALNKIILRNPILAPLGDVNALQNTPFASNGTGGTLYVPNDLISAYQSATNWSTILGYANNQIKSIESTHTDPTAPVDLTTHYIDGTLIPSS